MGKYLNEAAKKRGHRVTWVRCPEDAQTARDLQRKLSGLLAAQDAFLMAAAVAGGSEIGVLTYRATSLQSAGSRSR